jgi:hypothetical protein
MEFAMRLNALGLAGVAVPMHAIPALAHNSFAMFYAEMRITLRRKGILCFVSDKATSSPRRYCWWLAFLIIVQSALWVASACPQSLASTVKEFDMFGTWAHDCSMQPSPANHYAIVSLTSRGNVELRNDFGPDYAEMVYRIVNAQRLSYFRLALRQLLTTDDQIALNTVMMKTNDRIRVWSSHASDGSILVEDGAIPSANGQETGWMVRCNVRSALERFGRLGASQSRDDSLE